MKALLALSLAVTSLSLPFHGAWAQTPARSFSEIPIGRYPGIVKLERGVSPGIASGSHSGIYIRFAEDISNLCAKYNEGPGREPFRLNVFATQGGFDSLKRLRREDEVQLAVVQSDLWFYAKLASAMGTSGRPLTPDEKRIQESWKEIYDNIRLLLPLYQEKIHILVKPSDKGTKYKDLYDLFAKEARVNVGTQGSGILVTCTLLEEMLTRAEGGTGGKKWKPSYLDAETALRRLTAKPGEGDTLDAVILVGGVPFPALDRFSVDYIKEAKMKNLVRDLFAGEQIVPHLALLPFGEKADQLIDSSGDFKGYLPAEIEVKDYPFLSTETAPIKTRAIMACLVTHAKYNEAAGKEAHKILWVRHILYRVLSKMRPNTDHGLVQDYGVPLAGDKWKEAALNLQAINQGASKLTWEGSFGWPLHDDKLLREMLKSWGLGLPGGTSTSRSIIDPDSQF